MTSLSRYMCVAWLVAALSLVTGQKSIQIAQYLGRCNNDWREHAAAPGHAVGVSGMITSLHASARVVPIACSSDCFNDERKFRIMVKMCM
mmetsp:Transcript_35524/g.77800  ORF Transcript_35524/g.77800 Transcript_35524/m.77800 type:complete len:90 (+) Transcript_35524:2742-3011(+)